MPRSSRLALALAFCGLCSLAAAAPAAHAGEMSRELDDSRREVRRELAQARHELEHEDLSLGEGLHIGRSSDNARRELPEASITPRGDLLIEGRAVAIDARQRQLLLAYRGRVIDIAHAGIDIGERSAQAAIDAVDRGLFGLMVGAFTGGLERRVEKMVKESVEPGVREICRSLPQLLDTQQALTRSVPEFGPYATLEAGDVEDCEAQLREAFVSR